MSLPVLIERGLLCAAETSRQVEKEFLGNHRQGVGQEKARESATRAFPSRPKRRKEDIIKRLLRDFGSDPAIPISKIKVIEQKRDGLGRAHHEAGVLWMSASAGDSPTNLDEQVEVLSLMGNFALHGTEKKVHAHIVLGKRDGSAHGGHLLMGYVRPTLEVVAVEPLAGSNECMMKRRGCLSSIRAHRG